MHTHKQNIVGDYNVFFYFAIAAIISRQGRKNEVKTRLLEPCRESDTGMCRPGRDFNEIILRC